MLLAHTACPNDKLYNWLSLHPADVDFHQTSSPLLFHKYCCNSHSSRMQMYQGGRELRSKFTEVKEEGFHSHLLDVSYSDVRTVPLFSPNQWSYTPQLGRRRLTITCSPRTKEISMLMARIELATLQFSGWNVRFSRSIRRVVSSILASATKIFFVPGEYGFSSFQVENVHWKCMCAAH